MTIKLYDLAVMDGRRPSPFCWRIKYALAHKELPFETVPVGFTQVKEVCGGGYKTVPIIDDSGTVVCDSWAIVDYLDKTYPDRRKVISSPAELGLCHFIDAWLFTNVALHILPMYVKDIHDHVFPEDRAYFRESREKRLGRTLEQLAEGREARLEQARAAFEPIRLLVQRKLFLSGEEPGYGDYMIAGILLWIASVAMMPLLKADDPLLPWLERMRDLYGGLGRSASLNALTS